LWVTTMSGYKGIDVWAQFIYKEGIGFKVELRSKNFAVNEFARKYNGGGHKNAAGCRVSNFKQLKELIADLNKDLDK
jgi:phosphoesterase RecJ-like protein